MITKLIRRISLPYRVALTSLALALAAGAPSSADAMIVFDPTNFGENVMQVGHQLEELEKMGAQLQQLQNTFSQLQQTYATIESTISNMGLNLIPINNQLQEISDADKQAQITQECGGFDPVGSIMSFAGFDMTKDVVSQQRAVCQQIIEAQTDKYNAAIKLLNNMNNYSSTLGTIANTLGSLSRFSAGGRETLSVETSKTMTAMTADMNNTEQQIKRDDIMIASLQVRQSQLAKVALRGSQSMVGNAMQAVVFTTAFSAN